jgi:hypothetical protein
LDGVVTVQAEVHNRAGRRSKRPSSTGSEGPSAELAGDKAAVEPEHLARWFDG